MKTKRLNRILVANRGEIAIRVIEAIHKLGKSAVAVYSSVDADLPFVKLADEAFPLGDGSLQETYLNQEKMLSIAREHNCQAIHPGYGFLSENASFSENCKKNGVVFIGPDASIIDLMGNKANARESARKNGVPVIDGITGSAKEILAAADTLKYPVLIKPAAGGGGKGMVIVNAREELADSLADAKRSAMNFFGSDDLYVEHYIKHARHIEVQVIADEHGNAVHLYERECSLQRRYQKIIEEAPSVSLSEKTREKITSTAVKFTKAIGYRNAGTIEFLMNEKQEFFFIEMNTRIQVEHPVTEMITNIDIVAEQIRIAAGKPLSFKQEDVSITGHAIEARIYAEDTSKGFIPSTGTIEYLDLSRARARIDSGFRAGNSITPFYDPMIAKIIVGGVDRENAKNEMLRALRHYTLSGLSTNTEFLLTLLESDSYQANDFHTRYIDEAFDGLMKAMEKRRESISEDRILAAATVASLEHRYDLRATRSIFGEMGQWRINPSIGFLLNEKQHQLKVSGSTEQGYELTIDGSVKGVELTDKERGHHEIVLDGVPMEFSAIIKDSRISICYDGAWFHLIRKGIPDPDRLAASMVTGEEGDASSVQAPLNGKVVKINVERNASVKKGETLLVIESMKMENKITAPRDAIVKSVDVEMDSLVAMNEIVLTFKTD